MNTRIILRILFLCGYLSAPLRADFTTETPTQIATQAPPVSARCTARYADLWKRGAPITPEAMSADIRQLGAAHQAVGAEIAALQGMTATGESVPVKTLTESQIHFLRKELKLPYLNDKELVGAKAMRGPFVGAYVNQLVTLQKVLEAEAARRKGALMLMRHGMQADPFDVDTLAMIIKNMPTPPAIADKAALQAILDAGRAYRTAENQFDALPGYSEDLKRAWRIGIRKKCCVRGACAGCPTAFGRFDRTNEDRMKNGGVPPAQVLALLPDGEPGDLVLFNTQLISPEMRAEIGAETP